MMLLLLKVQNIFLFVHKTYFPTYFRALMDSVRYNKPQTFHLFLDYMEKPELRNVAKCIDDAMDKRKTQDNNSKKELSRFKQILLRRQMTIT